MGSSDQQLQDICQLIVDCPHSSAKDEGAGYPLIRTPNVGRGRLILNGVQRVSRSVYLERVSRAVPRQGDLILAREAPAGNVAIIDSDYPVCLGQRTMLLRPDNNLVNPYFLVYYLNAPEQRARLLRLSNGATVPHVNVADVRAFPVHLPTRARQDRIASVIKPIDDILTLHACTNGYLAALIAARFAEDFGDDCHTARLGDVLRISTKTAKPQDHAGEIWEHYSIPAFDESHRPVMEPANEIKSNKYIVSRNSILISKLNPSIKRFWLPACLTDHPVCSTEFIVFEPTRPENKSFYSAAISSNNFQNYLMAHVTGSTGSRQRAQPKSTLDFPMPNPSESEIHKFCSFADPIYAQMECCTRESANLERLRDTLLPKLMSGEIDVSKIEVPTSPNSHLCER